jgi:hypothetical protein
MNKLSLRADYYGWSLQTSFVSRKAVNVYIRVFEFLSRRSPLSWTCQPGVLDLGDFCGVNDCPSTRRASWPNHLPGYPLIPLRMRSYSRRLTIHYREHQARNSFRWLRPWSRRPGWHNRCGKPTKRFRVSNYFYGAILRRRSAAALKCTRPFAYERRLRFLRARSALEERPLLAALSLVLHARRFRTIRDNSAADNSRFTLFRSRSSLCCKVLDW